MAAGRPPRGPRGPRAGPPPGWAPRRPPRAGTNSRSYPGGTAAGRRPRAPSPSGRPRRPRRSRPHRGGPGPARGRPNESCRAERGLGRAHPTACLRRRGPPRRERHRVPSPLRRAGSPSFVRPPVNRLDRPNDRGVAGAPAEVLAQLREQVLRRRGPALLLEKPRERHDEPGRAVAALESAGVPERLLNRPAHRIVRNPFDRRDLRALDLMREREAAEGTGTVDEDRARTTPAAAAPFLCSLEAQPPTQRVEQTLLARDVLDRPRTAVHGEGEAGRRHGRPSPRAA